MDSTREAGTSSPVEVRGICKSFGDTAVLRDIDLAVGTGEMVALLGPSGCGKTTLLRIIAGLETPDSGEIRVAERLLTGDGVVVPPERRRVGMVFQDWALFPHMTVARNVAYGLEKSPHRADRVAAALDMVGLAGLGDRSPTTLSGGQQQRVALARAIAPEPEVLLLDEPFSNLDAALREQVRGEVHQLLVGLGVTTIFVTHDQAEAFLLGDEVAVMNDGLIVQQATPAELYRRPASRWVAGFVGDANLIAGEADGSAATTVLGTVAVEGAHHGSVELVLRPEDLRVTAGSAASIELVEYYGHDTVYVVVLDDTTTLRVRATSSPEFGRGDRVEVHYAGGPAVAFAVESGVGASSTP